VQIRHREWDLGEPKLAPIVHQSRPIAKGEEGIGQEGHLPPLTRNAPSARIGVRSPDARNARAYADTGPLWRTGSDAGPTNSN
jgi:hypothetical protein